MDRAAKNPIVGSKIVPERVCGRSVDPSDVNVICGKPAIRHVFWNPEPEGWEHNFVCAEHLTEARTYRPMYEHPLGADCGMPGSLFFAEENACRTPEGGFPVAEVPDREMEATRV